MPRWLKWLLIGVGSLVLLAMVAVTLLNLAAGSPTKRQFDVAAEPVPVSNEPATLERGSYLARAVGVCVVCHGADLAGQEMFDSPIFGSIHTPNLTTGAGGIGSHYDVEDWVLAIRHGISPDGTGIVFMPSDYYWHLTDEDLGALVSYLQSLPPVDNERAETRLGPIAGAMINAGMSGEVVRAAEIDHDSRPQRPADNGAYLLAAAGCSFCHGSDLRGGQGPEPGAPPSPDLTPSGDLGNWGLDDFATVLRLGRTPDGHQIDSRFMPWEGYGNLTDADIEAMWDYLQSIEAGG